MQRLATLFADALKRVKCGLLFVAQVIFDARAWQVLWQRGASFPGVPCDLNLRRLGRNGNIYGSVEQLRLTRQALRTRAEASAIELRDLMLQALQLLPQHACEPVLFECEGLQRLELDWQIPGSDGGGQHTNHDAQLLRRLQAS